MANKTIPQYVAAVTIDASLDQLLIYSSSLAAYRKINRNTLLGITGAPVGTTDTQTISAKTFTNTNSYTAKDGSFTLQNTTDNTKQGIFSLAGITTATTRTYTLPNASVTLASLTGTETLTNKTITSPVITGGSIDNSTITVDSISGHTTSTIVSVAGVQMNNGVIATSGAVTGTSILAGAVSPNSLIASSGAGWAWQTFIPSWTNLTPGNGTITARYTQIGKLVWVYMYVIFGNTSVMGSDPQFTPPVAASTVYTTVAQNSIVGFGSLQGGGFGAIPAPFFNASNASIHIGYFLPSATNNALAISTASAPGTWTTNSFFNITVFYEAA